MSTFAGWISMLDSGRMDMRLVTHFRWWITITSKYMRRLPSFLSHQLSYIFSVNGKLMLHFACLTTPIISLMISMVGVCRTSITFNSAADFCLQRDDLAFITFSCILTWMHIWIIARCHRHLEPIRVKMMSLQTLSLCWGWRISGIVESVFEISLLLIPSKRLKEFNCLLHSGHYLLLFEHMIKLLMILLTIFLLNLINSWLILIDLTTALALSVWLLLTINIVLTSVALTFR